MNQSWPPSASLATLTERANILSAIRDYFAGQQVLEVETPQLSHHGVTDVYLQNIGCEFSGPGYPQALPLYLQTSPEYAMKRLLCAGSGCIYQIAKAFRNDELGVRHNPEFTLLEWYRLGFDHHRLMDDVQRLMSRIMPKLRFQRLSYQQAFIQWLDIDPLGCTLHELQQLANHKGLGNTAEQEQDKDFLLQWLFSEHIEPHFAEQCAMFVYDFPRSQAALARTSKDDPRVAHRFELYYKGVELANGFYELTDADEQYQRFVTDNDKRQALGLPTMAIDERFMAGLRCGLPDCAGVAMGIDRLVMLALNKDDIREVIAFPLDRA